MPTYQCDYLSNGQRHRCRVNAQSPAGAAEIMRRLPWASGCGPVGRPQRIGLRQSFTETAAQFVAAALVVGSMSVAAMLLQPASIHLAANDDAMMQAR